MYNEGCGAWAVYCIVGRMEAQMKDQQSKKTPEAGEAQMARITLTVPDHLYRAYHRCTWLLINETGKSQLQIMEEMVRDFLAKHGC